MQWRHRRRLFMFKVALCFCFCAKIMFYLVALNFFSRKPCVSAHKKLLKVTRRLLIIHAWSKTFLIQFFAIKKKMSVGCHCVAMPYFDSSPRCLHSVAHMRWKNSLAENKSGTKGRQWVCGCSLMEIRLYDRVSKYGVEFIQFGRQNRKNTFPWLPQLQFKLRNHSASNC